MALGTGDDGLRRPLDHEAPAPVAAVRTEVDHPVGRLHDVEVVLDHDDRVPGVDEASEDAEQLADVLEVQARRRLVQHVEGAARGSPRELGGELHPLRLPPRQRRRRLAEAHVGEPDVDQRLEVAGDHRLVLEERQALLAGEVEHLCDRVALPGHVEGVPVVARPLADLAGDVHVRQEVHLDADGPVAGTGLAAPATDVEGEAPRSVAPDLRLVRLAEQPPDVVEDSRVGGRVRPRGPPDGRLVDRDHLVELLDALHPPVPSRRHPRALELGLERPEEDVVDERRLPRTGHARHRDQAAEREAHVDAGEVVLGRTAHPEPPLAGRPALRWDVDASPPREVATGDRLRARSDLSDRARHDDPPTVLARPRPDVHDVVGHADRVLVVLDHDHGVAEVPEPSQGLDQAVVVPLVEPDRRLVEHVEHPDEARADLRGEPDALRLATREGRRRAVEGQVVESHVE